MRVDKSYTKNTTYMLKYIYIFQVMKKNTKETMKKLLFDSVSIELWRKTMKKKVFIILLSIIILLLILFFPIKISFDGGPVERIFFFNLLFFLIWLDPKILLVFLLGIFIYLFVKKRLK